MPLSASSASDISILVYHSDLFVYFKKGITDPYDAFASLWYLRISFNHMSYTTPGIEASELNVYLRMGHNWNRHKKWASSKKKSRPKDKPKRTYKSAAPQKTIYSVCWDTEHICKRGKHGGKKETGKFSG